MKTTSWTIKGGFGIIGEIFDDLSHADRAWKACGCGELMNETIEEAIRTYKREVEKMNEKVEKRIQFKTSHSINSNNSKCGGARDEKGRFVDRTANVGMAHW